MGNKADRVQQQESVASISSLLAHGPLGVPDGGSAAPAAGSRRQSDDQHGRLPQAQFDSSTDGSGGGPARNSASFTAQTAAARAARAAAAPAVARQDNVLPQQTAAPLPQAADASADESIVVALYDYTGRADNELSFSRGDRLQVIKRDEGHWWQAKLLSTGVAGWIPSNYVATLQSEDKNPWFHGKIPRTTAEYLLSNGINGSFLVRESESNPGEHSISVRHEGKVYHYRVNKTPTGVSITKERSFPTLKDLVKFHSKNADGLIHALKHPVVRKNAIVYGVSKEAEDRWELERSEISLGKRLGAGQYGEVYEGVWLKQNRQVAVKTLKEDTMEADDFMKEANVMKKLRHPNLVQLIGICTRDKPLFIITEFMSHGNLLDYLRRPAAKDELDPTAMMHVAAQIASGMEYLEAHYFIHRDLAARNCLVGENLLVKLADFGLSRLLKMDDLYTAREGSKFPIKWTAPESLNFNIFTIKSDVWAFGICLWEIATFGKTPYPGVDLFSVLEKLETGYRMPRPEGCPMEVYRLMRDCWATEPEKRPSFKQIKGRLEAMYSDGRNIEEEVQKTLSLEKGFTLPAAGPPEYDDVTEEPTTAAKTLVEKDPSALKAEIISATKRVLLQVQALNRAVDPRDIMSIVELLCSDTENLTGLCKAVACGDTVAVEAIVQVEQHLARFAEASRHFRARKTGEMLEHLRTSSRTLARAAKILCDVMRQLRELSSA